MFLENSNKNSVRTGQKLVSEALFSLLFGNLTSNSANKSVGRVRNLNDIFAPKCVVCCGGGDLLRKYGRLIVLFCAINIHLKINYSDVVTLPILNSIK